MQAAYQAGLSMPDQLSFVGYDDIDLAAYTIPPLTTVTQTGVAMGRAATTLLLDMVDQDLAREDVQDVVLPTSLVVRASTAVSR
jgi:LacI family transcriptional regulator